MRFIKTKKLPFIGITVFIFVAALLHFFLHDTNEGRAYKSRESLCIDFAQSYLRTIHKTEQNYNDKKWELAIDVETELYNLCLLDLTEESLKNFELDSLQKYKK